MSTSTSASIVKAQKKTVCYFPLVMLTEYSLEIARHYKITLQHRKGLKVAQATCVTSHSFPVCAYPQAANIMDKYLATKHVQSAISMCSDELPLERCFDYFWAACFFLACLNCGNADFETHTAKFATKVLLKPPKHVDVHGVCKRSKEDPRCALLNHFIMVIGKDLAWNMEYDPSANLRTLLNMFELSDNHEPVKSYGLPSPWTNTELLAISDNITKWTWFRKDIKSLSQTDKMSQMAALLCCDSIMSPQELLTSSSTSEKLWHPLSDEGNTVEDMKVGMVKIVSEPARLQALEDSIREKLAEQAQENQNMSPSHFTERAYMEREWAVASCMSALSTEPATAAAECKMDDEADRDMDDQLTSCRLRKP